MLNRLKQQERDIALIDDLLSSDTEQNVLEFKHNNENPETIGTLCSALSNTACIEQKDFAYVIWGIDDDSGEVVGTCFDPDKKTIGNQVFNLWLMQRLRPRIAINFKKINHSKGKLVLLEIPAAHTTPVEYNKSAYIRIGSGTPRLSDFPEHFAKLISNLQSYNWEKAIAKSFVSADDVLKLLSYPSYFKLTKQILPENKSGILDKLEADNLIKPDVGGKWNVTNLGAILFADNLDDFDIAISRKGIRFVSYDGDNRSESVNRRIDGKKGYAEAFIGVITYINELLPVNEYIKTLREPQLIFPEIAIREIIANALIHQDMTISGTGPLIELFNRRLEITNPGRSLVNKDRMIDLPPRSRNEALAALMRRMNMCEEQGTGLDKVIISVEINQLPPPEFQELAASMRVVLHAPRSFSEMTVDERTRACYQHSIIKYIQGEKMKNSSLCIRFGIEKQNAAQASLVIKSALEKKLIKAADSDHPRAGYTPFWA